MDKTRSGAMPISARFVHTNIVAHDWRRLADFYERVFGFNAEVVGVDG